MLDRRRFVATLGGFGAARLGRLMVSAAVTRKTSALPPPRELLLQNAYVMTMDPELGDIPGGDVHIKNGAIVAVGKALKAPGAAVFDGQHMIVLPGLVETHWHMWNTLLRSFAGDKPDQGYFPTAAAFGKIMTPDDMYHGGPVRRSRGFARRDHYGP